MQLHNLGLDLVKTDQKIHCAENLSACKAAIWYMAPIPSLGASSDAESTPRRSRSGSTAGRRKNDYTSIDPKQQWQLDRSWRSCLGNQNTQLVQLGPSLREAFCGFLPLHPQVFGDKKDMGAEAKKRHVMFDKMA